MEYYRSDNPDEVGVIEIDGTTGIVLVVEDSAFTENDALEVVSGVDDTVYILIRRGVVMDAAEYMDAMELGNHVLAAATSALATWKILSQ